MGIYEGATAIVTGAASGIGQALSRALVARGARVWMADIHAGRVRAAVESIGGAAVPVELDVRDAAAFKGLVDDVAHSHGGLGFLFNNAGIGMSGEAHELCAAHFDRIIDVNIRGVTNGVAAAYPLMVQRRRGHIVNTASLSGLVPLPLLAAYAMTKHAIVGLSLSLRLEARRHHVGISVLCPTAVDTPLLDAEGPTDLPRTWQPDLRRYLGRLGGPACSPERLAAVALDGIARNRALIFAPASARIAAALNRLAPGFVMRRTARIMAAELRSRRA